MSEEVKKISFGFSKLSKKTSIIGTKKVNEIEKVQFIDFVEEKSIKIKNEEKKEDKVLVIPLTINKVSENNANVTSTHGAPDTINSVEKPSEIEIKPEPIVVETLDSLAAKEILAEVNKSAIEEEQPKIFAVPLTTNAPLGEKQSSIEDYENIPVSEYGLAMLRGMGWCPGKGIGKNEKVATSSAPVLRPKGMGLGADKVIKTTPNPSTNNDNEELKLVKGAFVRIVAGSHKDSYGQVQGFDEESGRLFVKLSLKNTVISFNEFMIQLVNKEDFTKNSKVINVRKYEAYKDKEIENNKSDDRKYNSPRSNSPSQQKTSNSIRIKEESSAKHKSNKTHGKDSKRDKRSPDDSPTRQRKNRSREQSETFRNKKSQRDQSSSDDSLPRQRSNQSREQSANVKSKKSFRNQSSSSDSPSSQQKQHQSHSRENSTSSKNRKSHRNRSSLSESPPRSRKNQSQSGESRLSSKSRNYNSNRDKRKRSRSRSPRRKY